MGKLRPFVQKESYMPNKKWIPFVIGNGYTTVDGASGPAPEWDTAIGNPVSFNALTSWPLKQLSVAFSPVQSLNGYDSPWPAGGGKNKYDSSVAVANERFNTTGTASASGTTRSDYIPCVGGASYYALNVHGASVMAGVFWYDSDKTYISHDLIGGASPASGVVTAPANAAYVGINMPSESANNAAFNYPATVTTYSPYSNICPISGWSSLHVYDDPLYAGVIEWNQLIERGYSQNGITATKEESGLYALSGTANGTYSNFMGSMILTVGHRYVCLARVVTNPNNLPITPNANNNAASKTNTEYGYIFTAVNEGTVGTGASGMTKDADYTGVKLYYNLCDVTEMFGAGNEPATVEAFKALFPKDYYPYNAGTETLVGTVNGMDTRSISISLGSTVYSGWVDVISGVGEITTKAVDMGDLGWVAATSGTTRVFYAELRNLGGKVAPTFYGLCSCYATKASLPYEDGSLIMYGSTAYNFSRIGVRDDAYAEKTATEFKNHVAGQTLVFELATPIPIQLTPQEVQSLLGENVLFSDANGDLTVEYRSN